MVGWCHWLNGREFEHTLGDVEWQGILLCCSPWGGRELDMTEQWNRTELVSYYLWADGVNSWGSQLPSGLTGTAQFSSVTQSCPILCNTVECSMSAFPVHHQLLELAQTHVHWVSDTIQPTHPLLSPSPPALNLSQHQGLFQWVRSSHQVAKVLEFQLQHQYFQWIFRTDFLLDWLVGPPCSPRDAQEFLQHHSSKPSILLCSAFFMVQLSCPHMTTGKLNWTHFMALSKIE